MMRILLFVVLMTVNVACSSLTFGTPMGHYAPVVDVLFAAKVGGMEPSTRVPFVKVKIEVVNVNQQAFPRKCITNDAGQCSIRLTKDLTYMATVFNEQGEPVASSGMFGADDNVVTLFYYRVR